MHREKPKWTDIAIVALTILVALTALGSAWIFQGQLTEAHKARIAEERAWIAPVSMILESALENGLPVRYQIRIVNPGKEPALGVVWKATPIGVPYIQPTSEPDARRNTTCDGLEPPPSNGVVLYPSTEVNFWVPLDVPDTTENRQLIREVLNKSESLVIDGCFAYRTGGGKHTSSFRFFLRDIPGKPSYIRDKDGNLTPAWNFNVNPTGNEAD